jgi:lysophospholipase L1-like esterase
MIEVSEFIFAVLSFPLIQLIQSRIQLRSQTNSHPLDANTTSSTPLYNYTLFLGGTNDLGWGKPASEIWASIKSITSIPLSHKSKLILFTVPECGVKNASLDERRDELNRLIKEDKREDVYVFDLHAAIPYHSMPEVERDEIWDDGLHFTPKGYKRMGELVAKRLMEIIEIEETERGERHSG